MKTLNHLELLEKIKSLKGMAILGIESLTDARARKTGNPFGKILKKTRAVVHCGADYESAVNREALRQGGSPEFTAESLPYGQWLIPGKVIEHKGEFQLRTQSTPGKRRKQAPKVAFQTESGLPLSYDEVKPFLPPKTESNKQQEETGIVETVHVRNFKFDSIKKIRIAGTTYTLRKA